MEGATSLGYFDRIYVINLLRRGDRWREISRELATLGELGRARRIEGVDASGASGCFQSHLSVLRTALADGAERPLILEDDALFDPEAAALLQAPISDLPKDWDIFYLGYSMDPSSNEARKVRFHTKRLLAFPGGCFTTHAYSVAGRSIAGLVSRLEHFRSRHLGNDGVERLQIDQALLLLSEEYAMYGAYPMVATQRDGFSDVWREERHYQLQRNIENILGALGQAPVAGHSLSGHLP
jgi:GR25 family glycosyltransferase involved in LPS biosynthesis